MLAALALLSLVVGLSLGLLGGGGSILALPLLSIGARLDAQTAVASSLVVVAATSALGGWLHARSGNVSWRAAATFAVAGMIGAFAGGRASTWVPGEVLLGAFVVVMLVVAVRMWRGGGAARGAEHSDDAAPPRWQLPAVALLAGAFTGMVGAGGGFVVVPALAFFGGLPMRQAVGTSLVVIALQSAAGVVGKLAGGAHVAVGATAVVTAGALVGAVAGAALSRRLSAQKLQKGFAALVVVMALSMVVQLVAR